MVFGYTVRRPDLSSLNLNRNRERALLNRQFSSSGFFGAHDDEIPAGSLRTTVRDLPALKPNPGDDTAFVFTIELNEPSDARASRTSVSSGQSIELTVRDPQRQRSAGDRHPEQHL